MKIEKFEIVNRCLFLKMEKILVVGDLHLGYEENLSRHGISVPINQFEETKKIFEKIFEKTGKIKKIILLGDVKHNFGRISFQERNDFTNLVSLFVKNLVKNGKIIITKGNHDSILEPLVKKYKQVFLKNFYIYNNILFFHGDTKSEKYTKNYLNDRKNNLLVVGHFHPAFVLKEDAKKEKYRCFVYGKSSLFNKKIIYVPSFFSLNEGSDIEFHKQIDLKKLSDCSLFLIDNFGKNFKFRKKDLKF